MESSNKNIVALHDTIRTYMSKSGDTVYTTSILEADYDDLKTVNEQLYNQLADLKKKNLQMGVVAEGEINAPQADTIWVVDRDTLTHSCSKDFLFADKYRELGGNVYYNNDTLGLKINKDAIYFDYTVGIDKNSKVYIKSSNPYVKFNEISGFTVPKAKTKKFGIGPSVGIGYSVSDNKFYPTIGIGVSYNLIRF